jgi:hypothetical protein
MDIYRKVCHLCTVEPKDVDRLRGNNASIKSFLAKPRYETDLHFYWHAIHYCLTGSLDKGKEPFCYLLRGGEVLGRNGTGQVRYLTAVEVASFASAIKDIEPKHFGGDRFKPKQLDELGVYPETWSEEGDLAELLEDLREFFLLLHEFLLESAEHQKGALVYFNDEVVASEADDDFDEQDGAYPADDD